MSFAAVLAAMPDLLARALAEHVADDHGRCRECRADDGTSAPWPCAMRLLADEARGMTGAPNGHPGHPTGAARQHAQQRPQRPHVPHAPVDDGPVTAPQPPVSDGWDPLADRRAFRRERYQH